LPFGSIGADTNAENGRSITVAINDRGPFTRGVTLDLAVGAARAIGMTKNAMDLHQLTEPQCAGIAVNRMRRRAASFTKPLNSSSSIDDLTLSLGGRIDSGHTISVCSS
jgi:rare lipoprotein A